MSTQEAVEGIDTRGRFEWQQAMLQAYDKFIAAHNQINVELAKKLDELQKENDELRKAVPDAKPTKRRVATKPA